MELVRILLSEWSTPRPGRLVPHDHTPFGEQLFDMTIAEGEADVESERVRKDLLWETKACAGYLEYPF